MRVVADLVSRVGNNAWWPDAPQMRSGRGPDTCDVRSAGNHGHCGLPDPALATASPDEAGTTSGSYRRYGSREILTCFFRAYPLELDSAGTKSGTSASGGFWA